MSISCPLSFFFFFNDTATTEIYTLSLHDALPICGGGRRRALGHRSGQRDVPAVPVESRDRGGLGNAGRDHAVAGDRKSTRLNSSHSQISYAVFCLKKKKKKKQI